MKYNFFDTEQVEHLNLSFWQSPAWYRLLSESHQAKEVFYFGDPSATFLLIEIRRIGLGMFGSFSLGATAAQIQVDFPEFLAELRLALRKKKVIFLQIEPLDIELPHIPKARARTYRQFLFPYTRLIDLMASEDAVQAQMHEKGRYHVRLAQKRGVTVQEVSPKKENIDIWMSLLGETTARDGFAANSRSYYESFLRELGEQGKLYFAYWQETVIAAGIWVFFPSRAIYYYGASSSDPEHRKQMAPYLLQWQAIHDAQQAGIPIYDFLGVADPDDPDDHLAGVTMFKERFGGKLVKLPEKYIIPFSKKARWFFWIRKIKKLLLRK